MASNTAYDPLYASAGQDNNVDPVLLKAQGLVESGLDPNAVGPPTKYGTAKGIAQFIDSTGPSYGVTDPFKPEQAIPGQGKYMNELLTKFGNPSDALRAYNAGPNPANWNNPQTQQYVGKVAAAYAQLKQQGGQMPAPARAAANPDDALLNAYAGQPAANDTGGTGGNLQSVMQRLRSGQNGTAPAPAAAAAPNPDDALLSAFSKQGEPDAPPPPPVPAPTTNADGVPVGDVNATNKLLGQGASAVGQAAGDIGSAAGNAAVKAFGSSPLGMDAGTEQGLRNLGIIGPAGGGGTMLQGINETALKGLAVPVDAIARAGNALLSGGQAAVAATGAAVGQPQLGNDLAALPEAFPVGHDTGVPTLPAAIVPNKLLAQAANHSDALAAPLPAAFRDAPMTPEVANRLTGAAPVASDNQLMPGPSAGPQAGMGGPAPASAGAAATPAADTAFASSKEAAASQATGEIQRVLNPLRGPGDDTLYVPGSTPTTAEIAADPVVSQEHKVTEQAPGNSGPFVAKQAANNQARIQYFENMAGTPTIVNRLVEARSAQATSDLDAAFSNTKPVDTVPVMDTINGILNDPRLSENSDIKKYVGQVQQQLMKPDGTLKDDAQNLYGVRENITNMLNKASSAANPAVNNAAGQLLTIKSALDNAIETGAPGYQQYLQNYAAASKPIDTMNMLQEAQPNLTNGADRMMTFPKFDRFMKDVVSDRAAPGLNPAKSIDDDTMQGLFNIHADLARKQNLTLGDARGSPTSMMQRAVQAGVGVAHAGIATQFPVLGNLLLNQAKGVLAQRSLAKTTNRLLNPVIGPQDGP